MIQITAKEVNELRKRTGAGMMDCKKALVEANGDMEQAIDYLRKKGQKLASKRADREASEGIVMAKTNQEGNFATLIMLNCETDFVAKNQDFIDFITIVTDKAIENKPKTLQELNAMNINGRSVAENITDLIGKIGEKIEIPHYEYIEAEKVFAYNHQGNRLATIMGMENASSDNAEQIGHELTMQIAAMNPVAIDIDDVDQKTIDKEIEIGKEQALQEGKPEELAEKIAVGKLNKFYKENTLLNQDFIRDTKKTVRQYLSEQDKNLKITSFKRLMLGE